MMLESLMGKGTLPTYSALCKLETQIIIVSLGLLVPVILYHFLKALSTQEVLMR